MVSGPWVSGAPVRVSVVPAVSPAGGGACPLVVRTAGTEWGGGAPDGAARACRGGVLPRWSALTPPVSVSWTIVAGRVRHLRRRLRVGWGCGGSGFLGR